MPVSSSAKTYKGTINIQIGETYHVDIGYGSGYTVSGYWTKTDGSAFIITSSSSGNGGCTIKGNQVGTSTLNWTGVVSGGWSTWDEEWYWTVVVQSPTQKLSLSMIPSGGNVTKGDFISFVSSPADDLITFYYTTDGSDPKSSSTRIMTSTTNGFTITQSCTVKAYASAEWVSSKFSDSDVITKQFTVTTAPKKERTIHIEEPGTLNQFISEEDKSTITHLTLSGKLNGSDLRLLRYMAGLSHERDANTSLIVTNGNLSVLDLREASFVKGGDWYIERYQTEYSTYNSDDLPEYAFAWCPRLTKIYLPKKSTKLRYFALHWLDNLEEVELPQGLTIIENNFYYCANLKSVSIPAGVTSVSYESFGKCEKLSTIFCYANTPPSVTYSFPSNLKNTTLYVPRGSLSAYQQATGWKDFKTIVANIEPSIFISDISLSESSVIFVATGEMKQLSATVMPNNATNKTLIWSSNNEEVATVSGNGTVIAHKDGKAKITCKANDGSGISASCDVTVCIGGIAINEENFPDENFRDALKGYAGWDGVFTEEEIKAIDALYVANRNIERLKGIEFFKELTYLRCERNKIKGEAMDELIDCLPQRERNSVFFVYDNTHEDEENVCTKSQVAAAKEKGWVAWYKKSENTEGFYSGSGDAKPDNITLSSPVTVEVGQTLTLTPTIIPADAVTTLTWSSDDESIATVNSEGVVTGVKQGQTFINVETDNGKSAFCKLTVTAPQPIEVSIPKSATVNEGETITLTATLTPQNAATTLTWMSDDPAVATVDANGTVTGIAAGLAIIQVTTANGLTSNPCKLTVNPSTGIKNVNTDNSVSSQVFSLSGQRLAAPKKGINIVGGKKVIAK